LRNQGEYVRDGSKCQHIIPKLSVSNFSTGIIVQRIIVQIYEVQTPLEAETLIELDVDHIGSVVVSEEDWKLPQLKETINTIRSSAARSSLIPLYNHPESVLRTLDYYQPDIVHFCETLVERENLWDFCDQLIQLQTFVRKHFPEIKIMRSIPIAQTRRNNEIPTIEFAQRFEAASDFFLTDTILMNSSASDIDHQPVQGFVGITGQICNWQTARKLVETANVPVILAGGISPQNVTDGIRQVRPAGVDSCTRTNVQDKSGLPIRFKKDFAKVKNLVDQVRAAEKSLSGSRDDAV
jgi:phosphoribosylanthranilate isomerase